MATPTYDDVLSRARQLSAEEQLELLEALATIVRQRISSRPRRSIPELQGLGKQIWHEMDAQEYVNRERDTVIHRAVPVSCPQAEQLAMDQPRIHKTAQS